MVQKNKFNEIVTCRICGEYAKKIFNEKVLFKYKVSYYKCGRCGFIQTEKPFWLSEAYKSTINVYDTGILERNEKLVKVISTICLFIFGPRRVFLDYAGGYGVLVRKMRDIGFDFYWLDKYTKNLFARGFEYKGIHRVALVTAVEVFEHLEEPISDIQEMLSYSDNIFFTTTLLPSSLPDPKKWWYYGFEHGQHISFYSKETLQYIANRFNLFFVSYGDYHLMTKKKVPKIKFYFCMIVAKMGIIYIIKKFLHGKIEDDMKYLQNKHYR